VTVSTQNKTILIMAGGTGGHVYPALALARVLVDRGHKVHWLGTERGIEARLVPAAGYPLHVLDIGGIRGHSLATKVRAPLRIGKAVGQAARIIRSINPDVVVGLGGFAAGPGGVAAKLLRKPLVIHEQNAKAGTTNKLLSRLADRVLSAYPDVLPKSECIGNPVRQDIENLPSPAERFAGRVGPVRLLVLGGSLGAVAINETVPGALASLPDDLRPIVRHQTGEKHIDQTVAIYREANIEADVVAFIEEMSEALGWADLVICRAGALTVAELAATGVAAVLIPFPFAIDDHQTANAQFLANAGAAIVKQQRDLTELGLAEIMISLITNRKHLQQMAEAGHALAVRKSADRFADICMELADD
jgi:UDP-N-acetylglucosamine--N-acetylmuramyl-(pentapeptide) pyrophosphoryl-undecaprenol N-acetylglucosamine transferase